MFKWYSKSNVTCFQDLKITIFKGKTIILISSTDPIVFKVLLLGNSYSGKTTLFDRLNNKNFSSTLESFQMSMLTNIISNNYLFKFHLWDINGYPTIHQIRSFFYIGARSAIVLYDVSDTSGQSYNDVKKWIYELWQKNTLGPVPVLIVGNKIELRANIPT